MSKWYEIGTQLQFNSFALWVTSLFLYVCISVLSILGYLYFKFNPTDPPFPCERKIKKEEKDKDYTKATCRQRGSGTCLTGGVKYSTLSLNFSQSFEEILLRIIKWTHETQDMQNHLPNIPLLPSDVPLKEKNWLQLYTQWIEIATLIYCDMILRLIRTKRLQNLARSTATCEPHAEKSSIHFKRRGKGCSQKCTESRCCRRSLTFSNL